MSKQKLYNLLKRANEFREEFRDNSIRGLYFPYLLFSTIRNVKNEFKKENYSKLSKIQKAGAITGTGFGALLSAIQIGGWIHLAENYDWPILYSVFALNIPNGVHEGARTIKNNRVKKKSLETSVN